VKGKHPWDNPRIWKCEEEREYYEACFQRIREDLRLRGAVTFDAFGEDVARWLRKIGYVLSVSDIESFQMAVAEGIASGALPLIHKGEGPGAIFGDDLVHDAPAALAAFCRELSTDPARASDVRRLAEARIQPFAMEAVRSRWDALIG
jgi:glycosyltransferase involved in cell wall biosynthesis